MFFPVIAWKNYEKAGHQGWKSVIPVYNYFIWLKIIEKPNWWFIFLVIPFFNAFMVMLMVVEMVKTYGKFRLVDEIIAVLFPFVYLPWLGFSATEQYIPISVRPKVKKTTTREWVDAILFAVIAASIIRMFIFEMYTIPTSSMEKSLMVGDFLLVSKIAYGPKVPNTPLSFPFVHHTLPLTQYTKSFLEWIKLPYYRFPGFEKIKHGDVVVFNYPDGDTVALKVQEDSYYRLVREYGWNRVNSEPETFGDIISRPVDKRENYIKRCIGLPGDTLQIIDQQVYLNRQIQTLPPHSQSTYRVRTDGSRFNSKLLSDLDITEDILPEDDVTFLMTLTKSTAEKLRQLPFVKGIEREVSPKAQWSKDIFPYDSTYNWNRDNFGPIWIPKAGVTIPLNIKNICLYKRIISNYERNNLVIKGNDIFINGKPAKSYTFKMDYYWMMGDNRHNSADSRYWGFVPLDHIVGKASYVWLSLDKNKSLLGGKIRWSRMFRSVK
ncbi:MAG: signal peptidase I [Bacteroidota bacterium]|nr:signal peptidase I [Bacteroidota bacterium]